jgi:OHCU decarboxylase
MSGELEKLNRASAEIAEADFLNCCGSRKWARKMTAARPFVDADELLFQAVQIWQNLEAEDWLEAFAAHPKIGAKKADTKQSARFAEWSRSEQSGVRAATDSTLDELAEANRLNERKFGFIFIVCAAGKSAEEMLDICRRRLSNDADTEIRIAADEQRKITEIRLKKLLETRI